MKNHTNNLLGFHILSGAFNSLKLRLRDDLRREQLWKILAVNVQQQSG